MQSKGFKTIENRIEKLMELMNPPKREPIMIDLVDSYGTKDGGGKKVIEIAIQSETQESFLVVEDNDFDFDFDL